MKKKKQTLREMQSELLELVANKYYNKDKKIAECVDKINAKVSKLKIAKEKRDAKKLSFGNVVKVITSRLSIATLKLCDKLIAKEKVSNQIMGYEISKELENAEVEIKAEIIKVDG